MPNYDVIIITSESHPAIFKAFETISHDNGNQAGHTNYVVSLKWKDDLDGIEKTLATMLRDADSDFDCLCIGDELERQSIVKSDPGMEVVDNLLQEFFEEL